MEAADTALEYWDTRVQAEGRHTISIVEQKIEEINEVKGW